MKTTDDKRASASAWSQEEVLWATVKGFDKEFPGVLCLNNVRLAPSDDRSDIQAQWPQAVRDEVATSVMGLYDTDGSFYFANKN